jgi:hypothetical protein
MLYHLASLLHCLIAVNNISVAAKISIQQRKAFGQIQYVNAKTTIFFNFAMEIAEI